MSLYAGINGASKRICELYISDNDKIKQISEMYSNGELIYQNKIDVDKELDKINPIKALTSGQISEDYIGRTVILSNGACACQEWIIAGVNCQYEIGTVDLISKSTLWNKCGESGGQPNAKIYMGYDNNNIANKKTTLVDGESTDSIQYYLNNQVIPGFSKDIQSALRPMNVDYMNNWVSGEKGGSYNKFGLKQKICIPGDGDIGLYLENGTYIIESYSAGGAIYRTDEYCGYRREYFNHNIKWNTSTSNGIEYETSVRSYDTAQLLSIAKTPKGEQTKYALRSCMYDSSTYRYYINTSGRRANNYNYYFSNDYNVGAIIRLGNPKFENLDGIDPIDFIKSGKMNSIYLGRRVKLSMADGSTTDWAIVDISKIGTTLMCIDGDFTRFDLTNSSNSYESSDIRSYINNTFYNKLSDRVKKALKQQAYISNGKILKDMVILPSATELGLSCTDSILFATEGEPFQFFKSDPNNYYKYIYRSTWTRTADASNSDKAIKMYSEPISDNVRYSGGCNCCILI